MDIVDSNTQNKCKNCPYLKINPDYYYSNYDFKQSIYQQMRDFKWDRKRKELPVNKSKFNFKLYKLDTNTNEYIRHYSENEVITVSPGEILDEKSKQNNNNKYKLIRNNFEIKKNQKSSKKLKIKKIFGCCFLKH